MIYDYFRVTGAHDTVLDYADSQFLFDDVQELDTRRDEIQLSMTKIPSDNVLESLYTLRTRGSAQLKTVLELYDMEIHQKISMPNYQTLKTMVKRNLDHKLRLRNFDARHGRTETRAVSRIERDWLALKEEKVSATSGKKKASVRKETNAVSGMRVTIVPKNQNTLPAHLPSQPYHEVEVCRGREASKAKVTMVGTILRQPCRF